MRDAAQFVADFERFWRAPSLEGFSALLVDDVRLVQPLAPELRGLPAVRESFGRIFAWLPDLRGEVDRWGAAGDQLFIEFRLRATIGGRPFEWPLVDRFVLGPDGKATERITYFDSIPVLFAAVTRPSGWPALWRSGVLRLLLQSAGAPRDERSAERRKLGVAR